VKVSNFCFFLLLVLCCAFCITNFIKRLIHHPLHALDSLLFSARLLSPKTNNNNYNKQYVFGSGHIGFPCPLLLTSIHFCAQWVYAETLCAIYPVYFGSERISIMSWTEYLSIAVPCGLVTSGDIGLSNLSLVSISISFYTMIKSSTPVFVLGWAYLFGIERITWTLLTVVMIIAAGEFLTVAGEAEFDLTGFVMCLGASVLSGARWTLVQLKLQSLEPRLKTTIATMRLLAPSMFISMILVSCLVERPWTKFNDTTYEQALGMFGLGLFGAFFAIAMILCEFYLIMHASAIVLMIGGVVKEMITIFVGVTVFGDALNATNVMGCLVVFGGVMVYKISYHLDKVAKDQDHPTLESLSVSARRSRGAYAHVDRVDSDDDNTQELYGRDEDWNASRDSNSSSNNSIIELRKNHRVSLSNGNGSFNEAKIGIDGDDKLIA
jgi:solute carrier family 35 protein C2